MSDSAPLIETSEVSVIFGFKVVIYRANFTVGSGQLALILGPNGSGKSTFIRTLCGLIRPNTGMVKILGADPSKLSYEQKRQLGALFHESMLYPRLSVQENLELYARLYRIPQARERVTYWLERIGLREAADLIVGHLSRGMEQRVALARAMLAEPKVILMDEPFSALDEAGVNLVSELIKDALGRGAAIVLTSHEGIGLHQHLPVEPLIFRLVNTRLKPVERESRKRGPWRWMLT